MAHELVITNAAIDVSSSHSRLSPGVGILLLVVIHVPLALVMKANPTISTIHALTVGVIGVWVALRRASMSQVAYVAAYITGAEVIWRMTEAGVFWEYGKYASSAIMILALLRHRALKIPLPALLYFLALLPGVIIPIQLLGMRARDALSFNLSGPLALMVSAWFFSYTTFSKTHLERLLWALIIPVVGIASITFVSVQGPIAWSGSSNFEASGGFGANQVSVALGLGALAVWILLLYMKVRHFTVPVTVGTALLGLWFMAQALLTFSRGGVVNALIPAALIMALIFVRKGQRAKIIPLTVGVLTFIFVLLPALDSFTGGSLSARYSETGAKAATGRDRIIEADLSAFLENPVTGLGVGQGADYRTAFYGEVIDSHTEYTRLLAEHGLLGVEALIMLVVMVGVNLWRSRSNLIGQSMVIGMASWSTISLVHAGMRTVAPSFTFGLQFARVEDEEESAAKEEAPDPEVKGEVVVSPPKIGRD
ncbi:MAG TPA: O-antigen ligase family protein [Aggregatilineaceae bacterium]|nr:O-antigen ligase family protein [Aggregatilineaceae bacterium]